MEKILVPICKLLSFIFSIYYFGFLKGPFIYLIIFNIYLYFVEKWFNVEFISPSDFIMLTEFPNSPNVIISALVTDRLDFDRFQNIFLQFGVNKFKRLRQRVRKILKEYYWQEVQATEIIKNIKTIDNINSKDDIVKFCETKFGEHFDFKGILWEVYFQSNYSDNQSVIIFKFHHALGDGIALVNLFSSLAENLDLSQYSQLHKPTLFAKLKMYLLSPYYMFKSLPKVDLNDVNPFENFSNDKPSPDKAIVMTKTFQLNELKRVYKLYEGGSLNDLCLCVITRALAQWKKDRNEECKSILSFYGVSTRNYIEENELGNDSQGKIAKIEIFDDLDDSMKHIIEQTKPVKNKIVQAGAVPFMKSISKYLMNEEVFKNYFAGMNKKIPFIFTNVQGPKEKIKLIFTDVKVNDIYTFVPHGLLSFSIIFFSYADEVRFSFTSDKANGAPISEFAKYVEKEIEKIFETK